MNAGGRYEMNACKTLVKRNVKMFFMDKGTFFTALITPIILLVLYSTFLYNVYEDSFRAVLPAELVTDDALIGGMVGGLLIASLLAVSTITVPFCANLFMVQDRVTGARSDFTVAPVKPSSLALSYYLSTVINGLLISLGALAAGLIYLSIVGWYLSFMDVLLLLADVVLSVLFGTALSSLVCYPLRSQGAVSAVGSIVSAGYGFICGAYMPLSQFSEGLRNLLGFFPGTYGTSLFKNQTLRGVCEEMSQKGFPDVAVEAVKDMADCNLYVLGHSIETWFSYVVMIGAVVLLVGAYVLVNVFAVRKKRKFPHNGSEKKIKN